MNKTIKYIGTTLALSLLVILLNSGKNTCLKFDGNNNYVTVPDNATINITGNKITIEAWVYWKGGNSTLIEKINDFAGNKAGYLIRVATVISNDFYFYLANNTSGWKSAYTSVPINKWTHISCVYNGSNLQIFVNGIKSGVSSDWTGNLDSTIGQSLEIGREKATANRFTFNGLIDEVRIWNRALTQSEIRRNMCQKLKGNESELMGYWRMDEGSGNIAYDRSGNGNNGTLY